MKKLPDDINKWPWEWLELWAERSSILEYEANMSRYAAEKIAEVDTRRVAEKS